MFDRDGSKLFADLFDKADLLILSVCFSCHLVLQIKVIHLIVGNDLRHNDEKMKKKVQKKTRR